MIGGGQGDNGGVYVSAGDLTGSSPSRVTGLTVQNDTLVDDRPSALLTLIPNEPPATGNQITDVTVRNTILWAPNGIPIPTGWSGPVYLQPPSTVMNSLISGPDWAGSNANINGPPGFVNESAGDYRLSPGSPAIGAGSPLAMPVVDILGALRHSPPDIGAYESGAVPRPLLSVTAQLLGGRGTVTSNPAAIRCGVTCSARFNPGTSVTLTARADSNSRFLGWTGGCSSRGTRCTLTADRTRSVMARFGPR